MATQSSRVLATMSRRLKAKRKNLNYVDEATDATLQNWKKPQGLIKKHWKNNASIECGWGRLIFAHTFEDLSELAKTLRKEKRNKRDIALYLIDPHVLLSQAPHEFFLDPSHTFRIKFERYRPAKTRPKGFVIRRIRTKSDIDAINCIYSKRGMVPLDKKYTWEQRQSRVLTYLVVEDRKANQILGSVVGVDHVLAYRDPHCGSSLWALAVDPDAPYPGIGEALTRYLIEHYQARGRTYLDLSVLHNNTQAISLYEKLGFERVPVFCVKYKNAINEPLFTSSLVTKDLNPYAKIIINEARRRGIGVEILDPEEAYFRLFFGGQSIVCRESLSELTTAIAFSRCDNKTVTKRVLNKNGIRTPEQITYENKKTAEAFLKAHSRVVVKPARGEQGLGVAVDIRKPKELYSAIERARSYCDQVLIEEFVEGQDLRVLVINFQVVAASLRVPPKICGTGRHSIRNLIQKLSRRRAAATGGESRIPLDSETERCVRTQDYELDSILEEGKEINVRKTANLHTGGSMIDVTDELNEHIREIAEKAARCLDIPVVGFDFIIQDVKSSDYVIIEANERPGLANHEPQPTAERFIDLLFPQTKTA